jgi:hypothetical protein
VQSLLVQVDFTAEWNTAVSEAWQAGTHQVSTCRAAKSTKAHSLIHSYTHSSPRLCYARTHTHPIPCSTSPAAVSDPGAAATGGVPFVTAPAFNGTGAVLVVVPAPVPVVLGSGAAGAGMLVVGAVVVVFVPAAGGVVVPAAGAAVGPVTGVVAGSVTGVVAWSVTGVVAGSVTGVVAGSVTGTCPSVVGVAVGSVTGTCPSVVGVAVGSVVGVVGVAPAPFCNMSSKPAQHQGRGGGPRISSSSSFKQSTACPLQQTSLATQLPNGE